jgi:hypothetical protein
MIDPGSIEKRQEPVPPLFVNLDGSVGAALRKIVLNDARFFIESDNPSTANLVIFGTDEIRYIDNSALYRAHQSKCICITETDTPSYRMPGLYAANKKGLLTLSRTKTIDYFISAQANPNPEIAKVAGLKFDKRYLYSFMGKANSWPRKRLFRYVHSSSDTLIETAHSYHHWANDAHESSKEGQRRRYAEVMASSKFALCPRGCGISSYRLFESMSLGVCPVVISDSWRPIEEIDWNFALFVPERKISQIDQVMRSHADEWEERGAGAFAAYSEFLHPDVIASIVHKKSSELLKSYHFYREAAMSMVAHTRFAGLRLNWVLYRLTKHIALRGFYHLGIPVPVPLTQPLEEQIKRTQ